MDAKQLNDLQAWRADREASLRDEYSWLALAGLSWLDEGANPAGSSPHAVVTLPARFPAEAGVFQLEQSQVSLHPAAGAAWRLNGQPLNAPTSLRDDSSGRPDALFLDDLRLVIIERAGRLAARFWDPHNPVRLNFPGCLWYAPNPGLRLTARIEPYTPPKPVEIAQITGGSVTGHMQAALAFEIAGQTYRLDGQQLPDGRFDIMFKDLTAGKSTYGAGRFLVSETPVGDEVVLDFNYAYSPPCAFTAFATCPLPLPQNILPIPIEAGEQAIPH